MTAGWLRHRIVSGASLSWRRFSLPSKRAAYGLWVRMWESSAPRGNELKFNPETKILAEAIAALSPLACFSFSRAFSFNYSQLLLTQDRNLRRSQVLNLRSFE